jgi:hypothetical protein
VRFYVAMLSRGTNVFGTTPTDRRPFEAHPLRCGSVRPARRPPSSVWRTLRAPALRPLDDL